MAKSKYEIYIFFFSLTLKNTEPQSPKCRMLSQRMGRVAAFTCILHPLSKYKLLHKRAMSCRQIAMVQIHILTKEQWAAERNLRCKYIFLKKLNLLPHFQPS